MPPPFSSTKPLWHLALARDRAFWNAVPTGPGIYGFHDRDGHLLYLGKAKSLKARLRTYAQLGRGGGETAPDNVREMLTRAERLHWQQLPSEVAARERESELLHVLQPPFNIAEAWDAHYPFIALRHRDEVLHIRLDAEPSIDSGFVTFGCFKHRPRVKEGYCALLRLISAATARDHRFYFPARLTARHPDYDCRLAFPSTWRGPLRAFLDGRSRRFLDVLMDAILANDNLSKLLYPTLKRDFRAAARFYRLGPHSTRRLRKQHCPDRREPIASSEMQRWILMEWQNSWGISRPGS